jgi:hypothetical protein
VKPLIQPLLVASLILSITFNIYQYVEHEKQSRYVTSQEWWLQKYKTDKWQENTEMLDLKIENDQLQYKLQISEELVRRLSKRQTTSQFVTY